MAALGLFLALFVVKVDRRTLGLTLGDRRTTFVRTATLLLALGALALFYVAVLVIAARATHLKVPIGPTSLTDFENPWPFVILAVLVAPLMEEVLYRGMLTSALDWPGRRWATVLASATLFILPHLAPGATVSWVGSAFVAGLILAWSFLRTRSIVTCFALHAAFNAGVIAKDFLMHYQPAFISRVLGYG